MHVDERDVCACVCVCVYVFVVCVRRSSGIEEKTCVCVLVRLLDAAVILPSL